MGQFFKSNTLKLTLSYLLIIMAMSLSFSWVFYQTSSHELGRQKPPHTYYQGSVVDQDGDRVDFFEERIDEGRVALKNKLILLNMLTLVLGAVISYLLARYTLEPIENALIAQDRFVSDASHELRTPVTAMLTSNEVFLRRPKVTTKESKDLIKSNNEELLKLSALTDGLLKLARSDYTPLKLSNVKADEAIGMAVKQVSELANKKDIKIEVSKPTSAQIIKADQDMLVQLLVILLDNAIKYSPNNKTVNIAQTAKGKEVTIHVKDQGPGISKVDQPKIFERFYRADSSRNKSDHDGYGIGLAIATQITEANNARLEVKSQPGKGAEFSATFKKV